MKRGTQPPFAAHQWAKPRKKRARGRPFRPGEQPRGKRFTRGHTKLGGRRRAVAAEAEFTRRCREIAGDLLDWVYAKLSSPGQAARLTLGEVAYAIGVWDRAGHRAPKRVELDAATLEALRP